MDLRLILRRFMPSAVVTLIYYRRFGCLVSPRAEVEFSRNLTIGAKTQISSFAKLKADHGPFTIGAHVSIGSGCFLASGPGGLTIGDDCLISPLVSVIASNYRYGDINRPIREQGHSSRGITIGNNVWLGAGAVVVDGASIGDGAIVGPNAVVGSKVPANAIVQGNPARVVFTRR